MIYYKMIFKIKSRVVNEYEVTIYPITERIAFLVQEYMF